MLRPRDSHDLRLVSAELTLSPPGNVRWMHDVFGNSVALVDFLAPAATLAIASTLKIERYGIEGPAFPIAPEAEFYPFIYSSSDRVDLGRLLEQHDPDPNGVLARWADSFFVTSRPMRTLDLLTKMNAALAPNVVYAERHEPGTQSPAETLQKKSGACRDFAMTFIEAARYLGFGRALRQRIPLRPRARSRRRHAIRRGDPCLGGSLSARGRLDRIRPDRRADRRRQPDPRRGHARSVTSHPDLGQLHRE